ncbi:hypothetical protein [Promicromonospora sp. NFX87]|uniref:hypothetical protein n=1 Tax=Promicromonospora sp. NFX87 TaxID=3402691 RepID=UPI003AFA397F
MNVGIFAWIAVAVFVGATTWTAVRARKRSDAALPLGLGCVAIASALRIQPVVDHLRQVTDSPVDEVTKHIALVVGCVLISGWVMQTLTARTPRTPVVVGACLCAAAVMVTTFAASGPWVAADLDSQMSGKPLMAAYWVVFYGAFIGATAWFAYSALRSRSRRIWQLRWGSDLTAVGAGLATIWAVVSLLALLQQMRDPDGSHLVLGIQTRYLIVGSSVLTTIGLVGQLTSAAVHARQQRSSLAYLHRYVTAAVSATVPPPTHDKAVDSYHRTIQILDGIGTLAHYSTAADRDALSARTQEAPPEVLVAHQLKMAAARLTNGEPRSTSPADWTEQLKDESSLPRLGSALESIANRHKGEARTASMTR